MSAIVSATSFPGDSNNGSKFNTESPGSRDVIIFSLLCPNVKCWCPMLSEVVLGKQIMMNQIKQLHTNDYSDNNSVCKHTQKYRILYITEAVTDPGFPVDDATSWGAALTPEVTTYPKFQKFVCQKERI